MYISINSVDINIYPLTMECNAPLSIFMERAQYQMTILLLLLLRSSVSTGVVTSDVIECAYVGSLIIHKSSTHSKKYGISSFKLPSVPSQDVNFSLGFVIDSKIYACNVFMLESQLVLPRIMLELPFNGNSNGLWCLVMTVRFITDYTVVQCYEKSSYALEVLV